MKLKIYLPLILLIIIGTVAIFFCKNDDTNYLLKSHFPSSDDDYYQADSLAGHFHKPNVVREFEWKEHPMGKIIMQTNNLGLRNDGDTERGKEKNQFRVIVTGDSHTDGVLNNNESVAFFLEEGLNNLLPTRKNEVLNAGNGYFGPQNYLGVYYKYQSFNPDMFIVTIYTGNDFLDAIRIEAENERLTVPERPKDYYDKLWEVDGLYSGFTGQYLNQLKFFDTFQEYRDTALLITQKSLLKIKDLCLQYNTQFMVVLLPTKIDTEPQTDIVRIDEVFALMNYNESQLNKNREMVLSLEKWLQQNEITFIDLQSSYSNANEELFWKSDYHVNIAGHKLMANEILTSISIN